MNDAWDPASFRALGHAVIDRLADHLDRTRKGLDPVVAWEEPIRSCCSISSSRRACDRPIRATSAIK